MATTLSTIETYVRHRLNETTANYWTSAELIAIVNLGVHDLWRAVDGLKSSYFCTVDITSVSLAASTSTLTGIPSDCTRVHMLEVRDLTSSGSTRNLTFVPKPYNHPDFQAARAADTISPTEGGVIYWDVTGAGSPVSAPTVRVAPLVSSTVNLALTYVPTLGTLTTSDNNPIPGESDNALICWTVAYARAKERDDRAPDPAWLQMYATEKQNILVALTPRQDQELQVVDALFEWCS